MLLPSDFTSQIAKHFYDKTVTKLVTTETNTNGWVETSTTENGTFKANVQFDNLGLVQSELGLTERVDIVMTCLPDTAISKGDLFQYGEKYIAMEVLPRDSHKKVVGRLWA